jgi:serine/threonine protein phosphatase PrpC
LWSKTIPTPEDIEYYKPDSDKAFVKVKSKKKSKQSGSEKNEITRKDMVAASQRGRSHAIEGKPRDDDFALHFDEKTKCYIIVIADGAGSAKYSRKGSQIACNTAMNICKENLLTNKDVLLKHHKKEPDNEIKKVFQDTISMAVFEAYKAILNEAQEKNYSFKDFATTLILSVCKKNRYGWLVAAWWVGDGGIGIYNKESQQLKILGNPDSGEFAGQTRFLTMPDIIKNELYNRIKFEVVEDFTAIILMTDGVTDPKFETDANLNRIEKWNALWDDLNGNNEDKTKVDFTDDNEQSAEQLLKWLDFWSKGNHDDRTIAILF